MNSAQILKLTQTIFENEIQTSITCSLIDLLPLNQLRIKPCNQNLGFKPIFIEFGSNLRFEGSNLVSANFEVNYQLEQVCLVNLDLSKLFPSSQIHSIKFGPSKTQFSKENALKHKFHTIQFKCSK